MYHGERQSLRGSIELGSNGGVGGGGGGGGGAYRAIPAAPARGPSRRELLSSVGTRQRSTSSLWALSTAALGAQNITLKGVVTALLCVAVALCMSAERVAFKLLVDRMEPYRIVVMVLLVALLAAMYNAVVLAKRGCTKHIKPGMSKFHHCHVAVLAVLETLQLTAMFAAGPLVTPAMSLVLVQLSSVFVPLASRFVFPERVYAPLHTYGSAAVSAAALTGTLDALARSVSARDFHPLYCTVTFAAAALPSAAASLYREHAIAGFAQPLDPYFLNAWVLLYQLALVLLLSPVLFQLQGLAGPAGVYPASSLGASAAGGGQCLVGAGGGEGWPGGVEAECTVGNAVVLVVAVVSVGAAVAGVGGVVERGGDKHLGRTMMAAVVAAFIALAVLDPAPVRVADVLALVLLLAGLELQARGGEPEAELITELNI